MRQYQLIAGALAAVALSSVSIPALAADLPIEAPPAIVAVPSFSWSGVYVGGAIGYAFSDLRVRNNGLGDTFRYKDDVDSLTGTIYVGVNYQFDAIVAGAEADLTYGDFGGKNRACVRFSCRANADDLFGTIRGRVGFAFDRFLVFATGGLAIADGVDFRRTSNVLPPDFSFAKDESGTRYGYVIGAGVDYAVTDNIIVRGEYHYLDFGSERLRAVNGFGGGQPAKIDQDMHHIRAGVAYKF